MSAEELYFGDGELEDEVTVEVDDLTDRVNNAIQRAYEAGMKLGGGDALLELRQLHEKRKQLQKELEEVKQAMKLMLEVENGA